jgi:hypothetical protein
MAQVVAATGAGQYRVRVIVRNRYTGETAESMQILYVS